jgi:hypothetical protein
MKYVIALTLLLSACGEYTDEILQNEPSRSGNSPYQCATTSYDVCRDTNGNLWVQPDKANLFPEAEYVIGQQG